MRSKVITEKMIMQFERYLYENERSEATVEKYLRDVRFFVKYMNRRRVEKETIIAYKGMLAEKYALSSANSMLAALNTFFEFCGWQKLRVKQFKVQKQTFLTKEKELTKKEYLRLIKTAEQAKKVRLSLLIQTICGSGIRVSELKFITVEAVKSGKAEVSCKGKNRTIFLVKDLRKKLLQYSQIQGIKSGSIFVTKNGNPLNRSNIWREMKALCEKADVLPDKVFPHNLRHLFARVFYQIEKDIAKLADILGHSSINTTRIYVMTTGLEHLHRMESMHLIT